MDPHNEPNAAGLDSADPKAPDKLTDPARTWLRIGLIVVAVIVAVDALSDLNVFFDPPEVSPRFRAAQGMLYAKIAIVPLPALAALVFASLGRLRHAIVALAAILLLNFTLDDVPSVLLLGLS